MRTALFVLFAFTATGPAAADDDFAKLKEKRDERVKEERNNKKFLAALEAKAKDDAADKEIASLEKMIPRSNSSDQKAAYRKRINGLKREKEVRKTATDKTLADLESYDPGDTFTDLKAGWFGKPGKVTFKAIQVVAGGGEALMSSGTLTVWAEVNTTNMVDGKSYAFNDWYFLCTGTKQYTTVTGATRTVHVLKFYPPDSK